MNDAVPICRSVEKHWVFEDPEYFKLWYCILSRTQYKREPTKNVYFGLMYVQNRGEFLFGRREWSRRYGISEQRIRKFIELLVADGMIVRSQLTRKFSIYRVVNYDKFNPTGKPDATDDTPISEPTENPQTTHKQPTENPQTTTIKKDKKDKKVITVAPLFEETPKSRKRTIVDEYYDMYLERYKVKPAISGKHGSLLNGLTKQLSYNEVVQRMKMFFADTEKFVTDSKHDVSVFQSRVNRYVYVEDDTDPNSEYQKKIRREIEESRRVTF